MFEVVLSLLPLVIDLAGGLFGQSESDKTAEEIRKQKISNPPGMAEAEAIARRNAQLGMPGYELYKQDIAELLPATMNEAKEMSSSPSAIIDVAAKIIGEQNKAYNNLAVEQAKFQIANSQKLMEVLQENARTDLSVQQANKQIELAAISQEAQGTADLISSVERGVGASITTYGALESLNAQNKYLEKLGTFFENSTPSADATPKNPAATPEKSTPSIPGGDNFGFNFDEGVASMTGADWEKKYQEELSKSLLSPVTPYKITSSSSTPQAEEDVSAWRSWNKLFAEPSIKPGTSEYDLTFSNLLNRYGFSSNP